MEQQMYSFNLKDTIKSLKSFPKVFKLLWKIKRVYLILIIIFQLISGLVPAIIILSTQYLLNAIQTSMNQAFAYVLYPLVIYLALNCMGYIVGVISSYLQSIYRLELSYNMDVMVLSKAKELSLSDFESSEIYDRLRRAQNNAAERPYQVFSTMLGILSQFVGLVSVLGILMYWKPWIILLALVIPIVSTLYMAKLGHAQYKIEYERATKKRKTWYLSYLMTNDIAYKEIRLYNLGDYFLNQYKSLYKTFVLQDKAIIKKRTRISIILEIADQIVGGFILVIIVLAAFSGEILIGSTVAYIRSLSSVKSNVQGLLNSITSMYQNNLYVNQLFDFLEMPVMNATAITNNSPIDEINEIEFKKVSFKYPSGVDYVLKDISFRVIKGENISLVGENGSGKSTLVKLLSGFYDNYEGDILVNGISMKEIDKKSLNKRIGVIFQDFNKYEFTCRENVAVGNLEYMNRDDELKKAIDKAYANKLVEELPKGIDTQLGVWFGGGIQLSGGQWQRIALSRAFLRDSDCYILDEPSSALDPVSEHEIFKKTAELTKDKISIFISHRLFNLKRISSRILVLKKGELVEEGSHKQLIAKGEHYKYLYELQNSEEFMDFESVI